MTRRSTVFELLLPRPRQAVVTGDPWTLPARLGISADGSVARAERFLRRRLEDLGLEPADGAPDRAAIRLLEDGTIDHPQGYRLEVDRRGAQVSYSGPAGAFYGVCTLLQWIEIHRTPESASERAFSEVGPEVRGLSVEDHPDFEHRGVLLDISRNRVPTVEAVVELVELLASWKINQLQLYTEHTFAYEGHETVWRDASPWTGEEIRRLDLFCRERHVELVPNQNSFGHFHRWLVHEPYRFLAECPDGVEHPFSPVPEPFSLCPTDPRSLALLRDLYRQLLPHFSSRLFNVGLDETLDLGRGRSAERCRERGRERVYLEFLQRVHALAHEHGRRIMFWGDVILQRPELIDELPADAIALEWGYEADHPFAEDAARFARSGLEFYVCPGTSSWNSFAGRLGNATANLASAARHGTAHGAAGYLITDWGDHGHLQPPVVSVPGFALGAALAWNSADAERVDQVPLARWLDRHVFHDPAGVLGQAICDLGQVYRLAGGEPENGSVLFFLTLFGPEDVERRLQGGVEPEDLERALAAVERAAERFPEARPGDRIWLAEVEWVAEMLRFACRFGSLRLGAEVDRPQLASDLERLVEVFEAVWLRRCRQGGMQASASRLTDLRRILWE